MGPCGFIRPIPACWDHLTRCCAALRLPRCSASLRLPPSLPLMSPYGLPSAGYPASPRWHVFASLRLPTLGYTVVLPLEPCAIARVFCAALRFFQPPLRSTEALRTEDFFPLPLNATRFAPFAQGIWAVIDPAWPLNSEAVCGNLGKKVSVSQWVCGFKRRSQVDLSTKPIRKKKAQLGISCDCGG